MRSDAIDHPQQHMEEAKALLAQFGELDTERFFARPIRELLRGKNLQGYLSVIKHPMDFFTIENKIEQDQYKSPFEAFTDLKLVFENALKFNQEGSKIYIQAAEFLKIVELNSNNFFVPPPTMRSSKFHKQRVFHGAAQQQQQQDEYYDDDDDYEEAAAEETEPSPSSLQVRTNNSNALLQLDKKLVPLYFPHTSKAKPSTDAYGAPQSYYQFLPDPTFELLQTATATGFPFDQVSVPCFGALTDDNAAARKRVRMTVDQSRFNLVPKHKNDIRLFENVYRKYVGDLCEKSLSRGLDRIPQCEEQVDLADYELQITDVSGEDFRDITSFQMLPDEFDFLFGSLTTAEQMEQFQQDPTYKFHVKIGTYKDIKRMFGLLACRAQLAEGDSDLYCLVREPMLVSFTNGNTVSLKAHLVVVNSADLPKEVAKTGSSRVVF